MCTPPPDTVAELLVKLQSTKRKATSTRKPPTSRKSVMIYTPS
jgi:hypothetical protein